METVETVKTVENIYIYIEKVQIRSSWCEDLGNVNAFRAAG